MTNYCISIDWLQVCGYSQNLAYLAHLPETDGRFIYEVATMGTRTFERVINVFQSYNGDRFPLAHVQCFPRSSALRAELCIVKLENRVLYSETAISTLISIMEALHIRYKGITRIDFCYDCNKFLGGLAPERFLQRYIGTPFTSPKYLHRKGTRKFSSHMRRYKDGQQRVEYVRWGSENSNKCCYIYNKSLELKEVKDKPWIRETWRKNGLLHDEDNEVWRAEISIKCDGMNLVNLDTGELFRLHPDYISHQKGVERLFHFYAAQLFAFYRRGRHKRVRDFDRVELFERKTEITHKPTRVSRCADTGRTELICARKLESMARTYSDASSQYAHAVKQVLEFMYLVAGNRRAIKDVGKKIDYLYTLKGYKWQSDMDYQYFACIEAMRIAKQDIPLDYWTMQDCLAPELEEPNTLQLYYEYTQYRLNENLAAFNG